MCAATIMQRSQCIILLVACGALAAAAGPVTVAKAAAKAKPSKVISDGFNLLEPIDNTVKTESDRERPSEFFLPQSLVPPPAAAKAAEKPKSKSDDFQTGHRIPPEIIERRNKAAAAAAYVDSSSFRQAASSPPPTPPSLSSPLLDYALLSDEGDEAFLSTRDSFLPDYEFQY